MIESKKTEKLLFLRHFVGSDDFEKERYKQGHVLCGACLGFFYTSYFVGFLNLY